MTFEGLERFVQLVRCLNYSLAAEELYISQSTLSRQIMSMEQELGCKLIAHVGRRILLTESGAAFYDYAIHALKQYAEIRTKISGIEMDASERIRIGYTTEVIENYFEMLWLEVVMIIIHIFFRKAVQRN